MEWENISMSLKGLNTAKSNPCRPFSDILMVFDHIATGYAPQ